MPRFINSAQDFTVIGENLHTTRSVRRNGIRATTLPNGDECVKYRDGSVVKTMKVPEHFKTTQAYLQGNIKHFAIAVWKGVEGDETDKAEALDYVRWEAKRQTKTGAKFLDLNVDEASYRLEEQKKYMRWLVNAVQSPSFAPPSVDSSNADIIAAGLEEYESNGARPMLNSLALERLEVVELVKRFNAKVVVSAAGEAGMPSSTKERLENLSTVIEAALKFGIVEDDIYIDPLFFPVSVSSEYALDALDAISAIRDEFSVKLHITGGMSNISFGLPKRKLINQVFIKLAIDAGADGGIIDPAQCSLDEILSLDMDSEPVRITLKMLQGEDDFCMNYIAAFRESRL